MLGCLLRGSLHFFFHLLCQERMIVVDVYEALLALLTLETMLPCTASLTSPVVLTASRSQAQTEET